MSLLTMLPVDSWLYISALSNHCEDLVFSCKYFLRLFLDPYCLPQIVKHFLEEQKVDRDAYLNADLIRANLPPWLCRAIPLYMLGENFHHLHIDFDVSIECDNNSYFKNKLVTEIAGKEKVDFFLTGGAITRAAFSDYWSMDSDVWLKREKKNGLQAGERLEDFEAEMYQLHLHPVQKDYQEELEKAVAQTLSMFLGRNFAKQHRFEVPRKIPTGHTKKLAAELVETLKSKCYQNLHRVIQEASLSVSQAGILYTRGEHKGVSYPCEVQFITPLWLYTKYTKQVIHRGLTCKEKEFPSLQDLPTQFLPSTEDIREALERVLVHYLHEALRDEDDEDDDLMAIALHHYRSSTHDFCPSCISIDHMPVVPETPEMPIEKRSKKYPQPAKKWSLGNPQPPRELDASDKRRVMKASVQAAYKSIVDFIVLGSKYSHRLPSFKFLYVGGDEDVIHNCTSIHTLSLLVYLAFHGPREVLSDLSSSNIRAFLQQKQNKQ